MTCFHVFFPVTKKLCTRAPLWPITWWLGGCCKHSEKKQAEVKGQLVWTVELFGSPEMWPWVKLSFLLRGHQVVFEGDHTHTTTSIEVDYYTHIFRRISRQRYIEKGESCKWFCWQLKIGDQVADPCEFWIWTGNHESWDPGDTKNTQRNNIN